MKTIHHLSSLVFVLVLAFGVSHDVLAQKKKKKKKKKNKKTENVSERQIIKTDTSEYCQTYAEKNIDEAELSQRFANMALRRMAGDPEGAYENWEYVYSKAPGFSSLVYSDGSGIHRDLAQKAKENRDTAKYEKYGKRALALLDEGAECFGGEEEFYGAKAYIYELLYPENDEEILDFYVKYMRYKGAETVPHALIQIVRYATYMHQLGKLDLDLVKQLCAEAKDICTLESNKSDSYYSDWALQSIIKMEESFGEWIAKTAEAEAKKAVAAKIKEAYDQCKKFIKLGDLDNARKSYEEYMALTKHTKEVDTKYSISQTLGYAYYDAERYPEARQLFENANALKPNEGRPYYYIGLMYLSSGKLCGPGTGFQSQQVLWAAFDKFNKAATLNMDEETKAHMQQTMSEYMQYLPSKAQLAKEGLRAGDIHTVKCWINEVTIVRPKP